MGLARSCPRLDASYGMPVFSFNAPVFSPCCAHLTQVNTAPLMTRRPHWQFPNPSLGRHYRGYLNFKEFPGARQSASSNADFSACHNQT